MTTIKKLLLISITLFLGVMSGGVIAQTSYDFTGSFSTGGPGTFSFTATADGSGNFTQISNLNIPGFPALGALTPASNGPGTAATPYYGSLTPVGGGFFCAPFCAPPSVNVGFMYQYLSSPTTFAGFLFQSSPTIDTYGGTGYVNTYPTLVDAEQGGNFIAQPATFSNIGYTSSASAAAPEIDGALIPQVGFLIACLFLILGRRKENIEPMLTG